MYCMVWRESMRRNIEILNHKKAIQEEKGSQVNSNPSSNLEQF
jgi:hypothetical protein